MNDFLEQLLSEHFTWWRCVIGVVLFAGANMGLFFANKVYGRNYYMGHILVGGQKIPTRYYLCDCGKLHLTSMTLEEQQRMLNSKKRAK